MGKDYLVTKTEKMRTGKKEKIFICLICEKPTEVMNGLCDDCLVARGGKIND